MRALMSQELEKRTAEIKALIEEQALAHLNIVRENLEVDYRRQMESRLAAIEDEHQMELQNLQVCDSTS